MKLNILTLTLSGFLAALLAGCSSKPVQQETVEIAVPEFSAKHGLALPEQTRRSLGLKLVEVDEQKVTGSVELELRVYQVIGGRASATGRVTPEKAKSLRAGQPLELKSGNATSVGEVKSLNDGLKQSMGMVEVFVEIADPKDLSVGDFLRATAQLETEDIVVTIPRAALLQSSEGEFVYTASGEHLVRTPVKTGAKNSQWVEITDGLYAGDQVAVQPVMSLWMTELAAIKGGQACCVAPPKGK